jgi:nanoRNase/pAp phosphatase (c-di-AMP/oligoRNAs hydrolase)
VLPAETTIDALAAAFALDSFLTNEQKEATIAFSGTVSKRLLFLPNSGKALPLEVSSARLVVSLDTTHGQLGELSYETVPGKVIIYLKAKDGHFTEQDISVSRDGLPFDLLVVLGADTPEQLGEIFSDNTDLFYSLPRINIDISPRNEGYGTLNIVDVTKSSISELIYTLLSHISEASVPAAATALLAGILSHTDSLKNQRTTPDTFAAVADLTAAGANYTEVVKYLFKTERLSFLKLWGRSLARLKTATDQQVGYSVLLQSDFDKTGEALSVAKELLTELRNSVGELATILLAIPDHEGSRVVGVAGPQFLLQSFAAAIHAGPLESFKLDSGVSAFECVIPTPIERAETEISAALGAMSA